MRQRDNNAYLKFYYGAMGCSKTANALMTQFQYKEKGLKVWLIKQKLILEMILLKKMELLFL